MCFTTSSIVEFRSNELLVYDRVIIRSNASPLNWNPKPPDEMQFVLRIDDIPPDDLIRLHRIDLLRQKFCPTSTTTTQPIEQKVEETLLQHQRSHGNCVDCTGRANGIIFIDDHPLLSEPRKTMTICYREAAAINYNAGEKRVDEKYKK